MCEWKLTVYIPHKRLMTFLDHDCFQTDLINYKVKRIKAGIARIKPAVYNRGNEIYVCGGLC